jgi:hypothetical protein
VYRTLTFCGGPFLNPSTTHQLGNSVPDLVLQLSVPTTPKWQRHQALTPLRFRLFPFRSPLLGESLLLSFPQGTEMFQFPWFPLPALCVQAGVTPHDGCRVSPFGHPRINAWSAAPRGFSQPPASFIGARRQGIHRWLFVAWKNKDARARYAILKEPERQQVVDARMPARRPACLAELEGDTPSKQKRGRKAVPPTCRRAEARSCRLAWRTE